MARKALPTFIQSLEVEEAEVRKRDVAWEYFNELDSESNDGDYDDDGDSDEEHFDSRIAMEMRAMSLRRWSGTMFLAHTHRWLRSTTVPQ